MQDGGKAVWSIPYVSVAFFLSLKQNFIAYRSSKVSWRSDCIFEIHQLWQSGFSRVYSNYCCRCSFEAEIIKIGQSSHNMYSNNMLNFQESTAILNVCTKKSGNLLNAPRTWNQITVGKQLLFKRIIHMPISNIGGTFSFITSGLGLFGCLVIGILTILGYLMPNPALYIYIFA